MKTQRTFYIYAIAAAGFSALMLILFPSGFGGGGYDDQRYLDAANKWMQNPPYIGKTHWELRNTLVVPLMLLLEIFGNKISVAMAMPLLFCISFVIFNFISIEKVFGIRTAIIWSLIFLTIPIYLQVGSSLFPEIIEMLFVTVALWLFYFGTKAEKYQPYYILSGLAAAGAFMTRETAAWIFLVYGLHLALAGRRRWLSYGWIAVPMAIPLVMELIWLYNATGDLFYRQIIDLRHTSIPDATLPETFRVDSPLITGDADPQWNKPGLFHVHWALDPLLSLLIDAKFGLSGAAAVAAAIYMKITNINFEYKRGMSENYILIVALISFLFTTFVLLLVADQRYYIFIIYCIALTLAVLCTRIFDAGHQIACLSLVLLIVCSNLVLASRMRPLSAPARAAMEMLLEERSEVVYIGQPKLAGYLTSRLEESGITHRVRIGTPPKGALFVQVEQDQSDCARKRPLPNTQMIECRVYGVPMIQRVATYIFPGIELPKSLFRGGVRVTLNRML